MSRTIFHRQNKLIYSKFNTKMCFFYWLDLQFGIWNVSKCSSEDTLKYLWPFTYISFTPSKSHVLFSTYFLLKPEVFLHKISPSSENNPLQWQQGFRMHWPWHLQLVALGVFYHVWHSILYVEIIIQISSETKQDFYWADIVITSFNLTSLSRHWSAYLKPL